ncbi:hypothetical protein [uncultured Tateyamaria sp.]|uniref:hypothetical protein n=1 Tax=uncultured Tateyamaria sp. TaxID=455651 RepID=UPI00261DD49E|nr:hypothetical protein [uncultured Tateyamaria sp.]
MTPDEQTFFSAALSAGAILTGFCGTFLSFRIQREAAYHRQPALDYEEGEARDIYIGLSHFTSSFLVLILASLVTMVFGFIMPLLALAGFGIAVISVSVVTGGLVAALVLISGYFLVEMRHYHILSNRLLHDRAEWGRQNGFVAICVFVAVVLFLMIGL